MLGRLGNKQPTLFSFLIYVFIYFGTDEGRGDHCLIKQIKLYIYKSTTKISDS